MAVDVAVPADVGSGKDYSKLPDSAATTNMFSLAVCQGGMNVFAELFRPMSSFFTVRSWLFGQNHGLALETKV